MRPITADQCMPLVLQRAPGFLLAWQAHLDYWGDEPRGLCADMSVFSQYVDERIESEQLQELPAIFTLVEELVAKGDDDVATAACTCFLENLQNRKTPPKHWVPLLGPESRAYCTAWDEFTGTKTVGLWDD